LENRLNIRLSSKDLEAIQKRALAEGLPYQTLIASLLRVGLTSLEFGVMQYLQERPGKAIGRYNLLEAVWGYGSPTASNVVDVAVRSVRRKLGAEASCVETVRGTGYRYRLPIQQV
jgi:DNA-binding response OmpR family regulator